MNLEIANLQLSFIDIPAPGESEEESLLGLEKVVLKDLDADGLFQDISFLPHKRDLLAVIGERSPAEGKPEINHRASPASRCDNVHADRAFPIS